MTELFPPPTAPPFAHGQSNWPVILCSVLAAAYGVTMLMLMLLWCCKRPRHTIQVDGIESGLMAAQASSGDSLFKARTVNRGRSALLEGSTTPGVDLELIDRQIRMGFVRKVYTLLSTQLLATVGIVVLFIKLSFPSWVACTPYVDGPCETMSQFGYGLTTNAWVIWVAFVPLIFMICCLHAVKNKYPFNYGALLLFTLIESCVVAILCTLYFAAGFGEQILLAFGITMGIFLVLTLFTLQSKVDWGFLGPGLVAALFMCAAPRALLPTGPRLDPARLERTPEIAPPPPRPGPSPRRAAQDGLLVVDHLLARSVLVVRLLAALLALRRDPLLRLHHLRHQRHHAPLRRRRLAHRRHRALPRRHQPLPLPAAAALRRRPQQQLS